MRSLTLAALLLTTSLGAQEPEKIHDVGKDGLKLEGRIDAKDPKAKVVLDDGKTRQLPAKIYAVKLQGGKSYRLIMSSKELDSFLIVRDEAGKQIDYDDDSAGSLDSALTLEVTSDTTYTVFVAAKMKSGRYALNCRERAADDPPALGAEGRAELARANRLGLQGIQFYQQGRFEQAIAPAKEALAIRKKLLGEQHPVTVLSLNNLGAFLELRGDFAAARTCYEQALNIRKKVIGEEHPDTAISLNNLGVLLQSEGNTAAARPYFEQALAIKKKVFGERHPDTAHSLNNLGQLLGLEGNYAAARSYLEQALEIRKRVLGEQHRDTATSHNNLAGLFHSQGNYAAARPYCEQALAIRKKVLGERHPDTAQSLDNLGQLLRLQGDHVSARPLLEQSLDIRKSVLGTQHPDTATSHNNLAGLLNSQGDYAAARSYYEQALAIRKKILGVEHPDTTSSLNNLGGNLQSQGEYAAARAYFENALAIRKKVLGEQHPLTAQSLNNLGGLLETQGDNAAARPYFEQAVAIRKKVLGELNADTATSLNNLGALLDAQGEYKSARQYFEQALAIRKQVLGELHPDTAISLNNLGSLLRRQDDSIAAQNYYEQALEIHKKVLGLQHPATAASLNNLAAYLLSRGDHAAARPYFEQALAIYKKVLGEQHPNTADSLANLGFLLESQGDTATARTYFEHALAVQRRSLDLTAATLSERQQLTMSDAVRHNLDCLLTLPFALATPINADYDVVLGWKGAVSTRQQQLRLVRREPQLARKAADLQAITASLANLSYAPPDAVKAEEHRAFLVKLSQQREDLEVALARESEPFHATRIQIRLTSVELAKSLPVESAIVDFLEYNHHRRDANLKGKWHFERRLTAFVVRRDAEIARIDLGSVAPIAKAIDVWREAAVMGRDVSDAGTILRRLLWAPLERHLGDAKIVLIAPDGAIAALPFAALPGREPGRYLLEELTLASVPLPRQIPAMLASKTTQEPDSLLVVGDVDYGAAPGRSEDRRTAARSGQEHRLFDALENTGVEVAELRKSFARRFGDTQITSLEKDKATESAFRLAAEKHRWLHVATHGYFAPPKIISATDRSERIREHDLFGKLDVIGFHPGLLSGLAFAGANRKPEMGQDDGILTALEVEALDLRKTELVVLSACKTGLGKVAGGEGVLGLQRAFQVSGAKSAVTSLWDVDDGATKLLMTKFYENLWEKKMPKAEALRQAQLFLLREAPNQTATRGFMRLKNAEKLPAAGEQPQRSPPYYWAAWTVSGDWR